MLEGIVLCFFVFFVEKVMIIKLKTEKNDFQQETGGIPVAFVKPYPPFTRAAARDFDQLLVHLVKAKLPKAPHLSPGATAHTRGDIEGVNR